MILAIKSDIWKHSGSSIVDIHFPASLSTDSIVRILGPSFRQNLPQSTAPGKEWQIDWRKPVEDPPQMGVGTFFLEVWAWGRGESLLFKGKVWNRAWRTEVNKGRELNARAWDTHLSEDIVIRTPTFWWRTVSYRKHPQRKLLLWEENRPWKMLWPCRPAAQPLPTWNTESQSAHSVFMESDHLARAHRELNCCKQSCAEGRLMILGIKKKNHSKSATEGTLQTSSPNTHFPAEAQSLCQQLETEWQETSAPQTPVWARHQDLPSDHLGLTTACQQLTH